MRVLGPISRTLLRRWWVVLLPLVATLVLTGLWLARQTPLYEASATLAVVPASSVRHTADILRGLETLERRSVVATIARIPPSAESRQLAAEQLGVEEAELRPYKVRGSVLPYTNAVRVEVTGPDPRRAAEVADAVAVATRHQGRSLYRVFSLRALEAARASSRPVWPDRKRAWLVAVVVGLAVGGGLAVWPALRVLDGGAGGG